MPPADEDAPFDPADRQAQLDDAFQELLLSLRGEFHWEVHHLGLPDAVSELLGRVVFDLCVDPSRAGSAVRRTAALIRLHADTLGLDLGGIRPTWSAPQAVRELAGILDRATRRVILG